MTQNYVHRIRDPIHRFIHFSDLERKVIDSKEFQRLRHLAQLALTFYVYPGAMHSRFEHCLGAMELSSRFFDQIAKRDRVLLNKNFKSIGLTLENGRQALRLCALLHDLGHLPFSHAGEGVLPYGKKHEHVGIAILEDDFGKIIKNNFSEEIYQIVIAVLSHSPERIYPEIQILNRLISGNVDVDRTDYLIRDSYHCGVEYGKFDYSRLIETIRVIKSKYHGGLEPALDTGGVHAVEALILARYFMFTQVYYHRTRRLFDIYVENYLQLWNEADPKNKKIRKLTDVLKYDDLDVWRSIREDSCSRKKTPIKKYASYLNKRGKYHHFIFETSEFADALDLQRLKKVEEDLGNEFKGIEFILDVPKQGSIHKFHVPGEMKSHEDFPVIDRHGCVQKLNVYSRLIEKLPKEFQVYRLYADVSDEKLLKRVRDKAKKYFESLI